MNHRPPRPERHGTGGDPAPWRRRAPEPGASTRQGTTGPGPSTRHGSAEPGRSTSARHGGRTPPPANAGRVVSGRERLPAVREPYQPRTSDARWHPLPDPPPAPRRRPSRVLNSGKAALSLVSVLVLAVTGYYWAQIEWFGNGLTTADVIDQAPQERPADGAIDILMVGMDSRTDAQGNPLSEEQLRLLSAGESDGELNTDTLIMIRIPNDGDQAYGISLPRDSYVDIPGYGRHKINSAYLRAKNESMAQLREEGVTDESDLQVQSNREGAKNLIATVEELTGAGIDHYAEVNMLGFYDITNAIGGIEVCLRAPVDDYRSGARFPAGRQNLAGAKALAFVRQRHGLENGDLDRIVRQQVFMNGMAKKVFSQDMLAPGSDTLGKLRDAIGKSVVLDENWNVIEFAQQMMSFTGGRMSFVTIPVGTVDLRTESDGSAIEVDPDEVREFVAGLLGTPATSSSSPSSAAEEVSPAEVTVNVRNATGETGLADAVATSLSEQGFTRGDIGNATARDTTVVRHAAGEEANGTRVADALDGPAQVEPDTNLAAGTVTVLLGADFPGVATDRIAAGAYLRLAPLAAGQPAQPDAAGCVN